MEMMYIFRRTFSWDELDWGIIERHKMVSYDYAGHQDVWLTFWQSGQAFASSLSLSDFLSILVSHL